MGLLFSAMVLVAVVWWLAAAAQRRKIMAAQDAEFTASHEGWDIYISPYNRGVIAINREVAEVVLGVVTASKRYALGDIATVEVLRDGGSLISTNRGSQFAGAAIGGLAFGGAGMIVGGLSGSQRSAATLHSVAIKLIVDDRAAPVHVIEFFKSPSARGTLARSPLLGPSLAAVERFHALLVTALRSQQAPAVDVSGPADELAKMWHLRKTGALTDAEFVTQKARLLAGNDRPIAAA